ncbi:MAG: hypothetical protein U0269_13075 [Polyangiales bacterium]
MRPSIPRTARPWMALLGAIATAVSLGACGDFCAEYSTWASRDTAPCQRCEQGCRSMAASMPVTGCDEEFACVARCPDRSSLTCGCSEQCLRTAACRAAWTQVLSCYQSSCREQCR